MSEQQSNIKRWNRFVSNVGNLRDALEKLVNQASTAQLEEISQAILEHVDLTDIPLRSYDLPSKLYLLYFISIKNSPNIRINAIAKKNLTRNGKHYEQNSIVDICSSDENERLLLAKVGKTHIDIVENFGQSKVIISYNKTSFELIINHAETLENTLKKIGKKALKHLPSFRPRTIMKDFSRSFCVSETYDDLEPWSIDIVVLDPVLPEDKINDLEKRLRLILSYPRSIIEPQCISQQLCSDAQATLKKTIGPREWIITSTNIVNCFSELTNDYILSNSRSLVNLNQTIIDNREEFRQIYHTSGQLGLHLCYKFWQYEKSGEIRTKNTNRMMSAEKQFILEFKEY